MRGTNTTAVQMAAPVRKILDPPTYMCTHVHVHTHIYALFNKAVLAQTSGADAGSADPAWLRMCVREPPGVQNSKIFGVFFWS